MSSKDQLPKYHKRGRAFMLLPLIMFAALCGLFFLQLLSGKDNSTVPSALIGKPMPTFELAALEGSGLPGFSNESASQNTSQNGGAAKLTLINVWASWCIPCRSEHPFVEHLAKDARLRVFGLNYKDQTNTALGFLKELGNPYDAIGVDENGRVGIDFGVYGVPETFVVDQSGTIVYKFIGPISQSRLDNELMPAIEKALGQ